MKDRGPEWEEWPADEEVPGLGFGGSSSSKGPAWRPQEPLIPDAGAPTAPAPPAPPAPAPPLPPADVVVEPALKRSKTNKMIEEKPDKASAKSKKDKEDKAAAKNKKKEDDKADKEEKAKNKKDGNAGGGSAGSGGGGGGSAGSGGGDGGGSGSAGGILVVDPPS